MSGTAVLHTMKIRSAGDAARLAGHNDRSSRPGNSDPKRAIKTLKPQPGGAWAAIEDRVAKLPKARVRANSVQAVSMLLSASPEYFGEGWKPTDKKTRDWLDASQKWLQREFGDLVVGAWAHYDEKTPHLHVHIVPGTRDGRLSAKERFGRTNLRRYQTQYAKALEPLGIERGIKGSKAKHTPPGNFRADEIKLKPPEKLTPPPLMVREDSRREWMEGLAEIIREREQILLDQARGRRVAERQKEQAEETAREKEREAEALRQERDELRRERDQLRDIDLGQVLRAAGWERDVDDRHQHIHPAGKAAGRISVSGPKWYDHSIGKGAGGAIDLAMHLHGFTQPKEAIGWLRDEFGAGNAAAAYRARRVAEADRVTEKAPGYQPPEPADPEPVRRWLTENRRLGAELVDRLIQSGGAYASRMKGWLNAIFPFKRGHGAEVKGVEGTFKGNAPGSSPRHDGWVWQTGPEPARFIVAESPVDALAYHQIHAAGGESVLASTAGAKTSPPMWLQKERETHSTLPLVVAYDNDETGREKCQYLARNLNGTPHLPGNEGADWSDMVPEPKGSSGADFDPLTPPEPAQKPSSGPNLG